MKEKTTDIDILEDLLSTQKQYIEDKDYQKEHNIKEQAIDYAKMWTKATETLIAENKELKEKNKELKVINKMQEYRISVIDERELISKSKIEEKIEELSGKVEVGDITREMFNRIEYAIEVLVELLDERNNTDEH